MVLVLKWLPSKFFSQFSFSNQFSIGNKVQRMMYLHIKYFLIPQFIDEDINNRELTALTPITVPPPNIIEQSLINTEVATPLFRLAATFGRVVRSGNDVLDFMLSGKSV